MASERLQSTVVSVIRSVEVMVWTEVVVSLSRSGATGSGCRRWRTRPLRKGVDCHWVMADDSGAGDSR